MNGIQLDARFIGKTSCGFVSGWLYEIRMEWMPVTKHLLVTDLNGPGRCPYSSSEAFEANWRVPSGMTGPAFWEEYRCQRA